MMASQTQEKGAHLRRVQGYRLVQAVPAGMLGFTLRPNGIGLVMLLTAAFLIGPGVHLGFERMTRERGKSGFLATNQGAILKADYLLGRTM